MRVFVALMMLVAAAIAQPVSVDEWVANTVKNRADKSWRPAVFVSADLGEKFPTLGGIVTAVDEKLPPRTVQIRTLDEVVYPANGPDPETKLPPGTPMATYNGAP